MAARQTADTPSRTNQAQKAHWEAQPENQQRLGLLSSNKSKWRARGPQFLERPESTLPYMPASQAPAPRRGSEEMEQQSRQTMQEGVEKYGSRAGLDEHLRPAVPTPELTAKGASKGLGFIRLPTNPAHLMLTLNKSMGLGLPHRLCLNPTPPLSTPCPHPEQVRGLLGA